MAAAEDDASKIPVTILTGFLGSGKTTLLNYILTQDHGKKLAVIENEFGAVGIDDELLKQNMRDKTEEAVIEMMNGCVCCTVRQDLVVVLKKLAGRVQAGTLKLDGIVIETTGLADPAPVAQTFFVDEDVKTFCRLDGIITLVDAKHIEAHLDEVKPEGVENEAVEQLAFADRIIVNKTDLVTEDDLTRIETRVKTINAFAPIVRSCQSKVSVDHVLNIRGFDLKRTLEMDPEFLATDAEHMHDDSVSSVSIVMPGNVHMALANGWISKILREKGNDIYRMKGVLAVGGAREKFVYQGVHMIFDGNFDMEQTWADDEPRVNKLVFIGKNLDKKELEDDFVSCLDIPANAARIDAIRAMKKKEQRDNAVISAAHRDDLAKLRKLVSQGANVNAGNRIGQTALHIAALWCNEASVEYLLSVGANPNQTNDMGCTPLHTMCRMDKKTPRDRLRIAQLLVAGGADRALVDEQDMTAWEYFASGLEEERQALQGDDAAEEGQSAFMQAALKQDGTAEFMQFLMPSGGAAATPPLPPAAGAKKAEEEEDDQWKWEQDGDEISVRFPLKKAAAKKGVKVVFKTDRLSVAVDGETLLEGKLGGQVSPDECTWCLANKGMELQVMLTAKTDSPWDDVVVL